jgi:hypothetical protein
MTQMLDDAITDQREALARRGAAGDERSVWRRCTWAEYLIRI